MTIEAKNAIEAELHNLVEQLIPDGYKVNINLFKEQDKPSDYQSALEIQRVICTYVGVTLDRVFEKTRKREVVNTRKYLAYFINKYTRFTLTQVANMSGLSDHSLVVHHVADLKDIMFTDDLIRNQVAEMTRRIESEIIL